MFEREIKLYTMMMEYNRLLVVGIDDGNIATQPSAGMNTPLWILGHLAISADFAAQCLGLEKTCPEAWYRSFSPGTAPVPDQQPRPSLAELMAALEENYRRVVAALPGAPEKRLSRPHTVEMLKPLLPTTGDLVAHLVSTHPALHLGQLSAWRRLMGLPMVQ